MDEGKEFVASFLGWNFQYLSKGSLERGYNHKYRSTGRDGPLTSIVQVSFEDEQFDI